MEHVLALKIVNELSLEQVLEADGAHFSLGHVLQDNLLLPGQSLLGQSLLLPLPLLLRPLFLSLQQAVDLLQVAGEHVRLHLEAVDVLQHLVEHV